MRIFLCLLLVLAAPAVLAEITIEETMTLEGGGVMAVANMTGRMTNTYAADRARMESEIQMQSGLVRMLARGVGPSAEIVRLDRDTVYQLDLKKKRYTETPLAEHRRRVQEGIAQARQAQDAQSGADAQCEWSAPSAELRRGGEMQAIAGYGAERVVIEAQQACRDPKTGSVCEYRLSLEQWIAPDLAVGAEALQFQRAYAERMGYTAALSEGVSQRAESQFGRYGQMWKEVAGKLGKLKGYPVRSSFTLALGGPQCATSGGAAGTVSAADSGASPFSGLAGQLGGLLGGRKKPASGSPSQAGPPAARGFNRLLTMSSEVIAIRSGATAAGNFDVPGDFKKVEAH